MHKQIRFAGRDRGWDTMGTKSWNRKEAGQVNASLNILSDALQACGRAGSVVPEAHLPDKSGRLTWVRSPKTFKL